MGDIERRFINLKEMRVKRNDGEPVKISGYAAVFNSLSEDLGGFREKISPGAFKNSLKRSDVRALIDHKPDLIVGRQGVNLELLEDETGLYMELTEPKIPSARFDQLTADVENNLITQQSFGFTLLSDTWAEDRNTGAVTRTLNEIDQLFDVSPVTYPAYPDTTVAKRSLNKFKDAENSERIAPPEEVEEKEANLLGNDEFFTKIESIKRKYNK